MRKDNFIREAISFGLAFFMVFGLFWVMPVKVRAASDNDTIDLSVNNTGANYANWEYDDVTNIYTIRGSVTVTSSGSQIVVNDTITFDGGTSTPTIAWDAEVAGTLTGPVVEVTGIGSFELYGGYISQLGSGDALSAPNASGVTVLQGSISAKGGNAINTGYVHVYDGEISATTGIAVKASELHMEFGGIISTDSGTAVDVTDYATIDYGTVKADNNGTAVKSDNTVFVRDGNVIATTGVAIKSNMLGIFGGNIKATSGTAIEGIGTGDLVFIDDGKIEVGDGGIAIKADDVHINGGEVIATTGTAINALYVFAYSGTVSATGAGGYAIYSDEDDSLIVVPYGSVTANGGGGTAICAGGDRAIVFFNDQRVSGDTKYAITGADSFAVIWAANKSSYVHGTSVDLTTDPNTAAAYWEASDSVYCYNSATAWTLYTGIPVTTPGGNTPSSSPRDGNGISRSFSGGSTFVLGSNTGITLVVQKAFSQFDYVQVDGKRLVKDTDYKAEDDSTKITLLPSYLNKLSKGQHVIIVTFKDGSYVTENFSVTDKAEPTSAVSYSVLKPSRAAGTNVSAKTSNNTLILNGKETAFPAVSIDGYNYLKLRDMAALLNKTSKQFSVSYNPETNTVSLNSGLEYKASGEPSNNLNGSPTAIATTQKLIVDGKSVSVSAYNIDGYNYFRLRDIAILLNFYVEFNGGTVTLDLTKEYSE